MYNCNTIHKTLDELFACDDCDKLFTCQQCGGSLDNDMLAMFTNNRVCKKCIDNNHKGAIK